MQRLRRGCPASSCSPPPCTATRAASSWRPTAPTPGPPRACRPSSCRTTTRARAAARCAGSTSRRTPARASSCASRAAACSTSSSTCAAARPPSASGRASSSTTSTGTSSTSRSGSGTASACCSETADFVYKCTAYYDAATEKGIRFDDPDVGIAWPDDIELLYSERDRDAPRLAEVADELPFPYADDVPTAASRPSPTGTLHVGNLRTALLAWLFARSRRRALPRADGGPRPRPRPGRGRRAPARRPARDRAGLGRRGRLAVAPPRRLRGGDRAAAAPPGDLYECFCTRAEIRAAASAPHGPLPEGAYPGTCLRLTEAERRRKRAGGRPPALRVRAGAARVAFTDRLHGEVEGVVDDFVVRRNDGAPAYNLAVVVDDAWQGIGEVVRGDDLLETTPRQLFLAGLLGLPAPALRARPARARAGRRAARQAPRRRDARRARRGRRAALDGAARSACPRPPPRPRCSRLRPGPASPRADPLVARNGTLKPLHR